MPALRSLIVVVAFVVPSAALAEPEPAKALPKLTKVEVKSSLDGESQPILYWAPEKARAKPTPLFVFLHSWSGDYTQNNAKWQVQAVKRGWIYLHPNFRGVNQTPKACGSKWARQDILDAVDFATAKFNVDPKRIYLAGTSGGGHMAMLMAGHHPDRFSAVSAWVGISDLSAWYDFHVKDGKPQRYARMILGSLGGAPGSSPAIDADYKDRSPIHHLHRAIDIPLQICAGINDGYSGSVPTTHSLKAFNVIARAQKLNGIPDSVVSDLALRKPIKGFTPLDARSVSAFGREIAFHQSTRTVSVVIFDGGHEGLTEPACDWLRHQTRAAGVGR
ncbi:MAG: dipeptidyl aminopeptidase/acylaminoacyl peptidase [Planctomycetaceae bacterium]|jgi:dipeptidyl aminopeptidase/acylaminoacyl peptidase